MTPKPNLDLLRAVAVTVVVVGHTILSQGHEQIGRWYFGDIGLFGVYLFFVHTSLVLMWSLERRPNPLDFYIRRFFRIYPLAVLTVAFAAATHAPVAGTRDHYFRALHLSGTGIVANLSLIPDFAHSPFIHGVTWSLTPEIYMYLLLPCLFFYARQMQRVWPIVVLWGFSAVLAHLTYSEFQGNNFPLLIPDFLSGIIAYVGFRRRRAVLPAWSFPLFLLAGFVFYMANHGWRADWWVCLALGLLLPYFRQVQAPAITRTSHTVATYSYGVYLLHPFAIVLGMDFFAAQPFALQLVIAAVPLALGSWLAYHAIEKPFIDLGARVAAQAAGERNPAAIRADVLEPAP